MIENNLVIRLFCASNKGETARLVSFINRCYSVPGHWTNVFRFHRGDRISRDELLRDASNMVLFVAEDNSQNIVGCIRTGLVNSCIVTKFSEPTGYSGLLAVHPDLQGKGLGSRLLRMSERYCLEKGAVEMVCIQISFFFKSIRFTLCHCSPLPIFVFVSKWSHQHFLLTV